MGVLYHLGVMFWKHDSCATDKERIHEIALGFEDFSNMSTYIHGFNQDWTPGEIEHIPMSEYKKEIKDYKKQLADDAAAKVKEMQEAMTPKVPQWEPVDPTRYQPTW